VFRSTAGRRRRRVADRRRPSAATAGHAPNPRPRERGRGAQARPQVLTHADHPQRSLLTAYRRPAATGRGPCLSITVLSPHKTRPCPLGWSAIRRIYPPDWGEASPRSVTSRWGGRYLAAVAALLPGHLCPAGGRRVRGPRVPAGNGALTVTPVAPAASSPPSRASHGPSGATCTCLTSMPRLLAYTTSAGRAHLLPTSRVRDGPPPSAERPSTVSAAWSWATGSTPRRVGRDVFLW
jgi:hypothetical protein